MINRIVIVGHLGRDPELKYTPSGVAVAKFSVATTETWKDGSGEQQKKTTWHNVVAWKKLAELVSQYTSKGSLVYVEGRLDKRDWQTKSGEKRQSVEIVAQTVKFLSKSEGSDHSEPQAQHRAPNEGGLATKDDEIGDEDIPF